MPVESHSRGLQAQLDTLAMPGTFVIARDGRVHAAFVHADYTLRMEPAAMLQALTELG